MTSEDMYKPPRPTDPFRAIAWDLLYGEKIGNILDAKSKLEQAVAVKEMISPDIPVGEFMQLLRDLNDKLETTNRLLEELKDKV